MNLTFEVKMIPYNSENLDDLDINKKEVFMKINIYHTNDIHSNYDFLKRVHSYMQKNKGEQDFYLDSGDFTDLSSFLVQADQGVSAMELFMACQLDLLAFGNNEIDMGNQAIKNLVRKGFPMISCNLTDNNNGEIEGLKSSVILEKSGKRFLLIGIAPYFNLHMKPGAYNLFFMMDNLKTQEPVQAVRRELEKHQAKYDYCILLSHAGYSVDQKILKDLPEVDLCLGGHSHEIITHSAYSQSGRGELLGKITLEITEDGIKEVENIQMDLPQVEDAEFDKLLLEKEKKANQLLSQELPIIRELDFDAFKECETINFVCDCLHRRYGGDFAIMHHGIAEGAVTRPVSIKSLLEIFPSKLNPTIYSILGSKIMEAVRLSFEPDFIRASGVGAGFRGHVLGTLGYSSNVEISQNPFSVKINGEELQADREYKIVTDDYLQRGTGYLSLKVPNDICEYDKWFIRDLVQHHLQDEAVFIQAQIKRIK